MVTGILGETIQETQEIFIFTLFVDMGETGWQLEDIF